MGACSFEDVASEEWAQDTESGIRSIEAFVEDLKYEETRTAVTMGGFGSSSIKLVWAEKDTIGIYPAEGDQLSFPIVDGVGTNKCSFNGGGWALKSSTSYKAYSPFNRGYYYQDAGSLPVSMLGQKQTGNGSSAHLGKYDIQIAEGKTPSSGKISFEFKHQVCFLRMDLTAPEAASWSSVRLESDALFTTEATLDMSSESISLTGVSTSGSVVLELDGVATKAGETITAYMVVLPVNLTGKTLDVVLTDSEGDTFKSEAVIANDYRNFKAGYARWIKAEDFLPGGEGTPYLTFEASTSQNLTMTNAVETLEYSVGGSEWEELGVNTIEFGGASGSLRMRGKSEKGTAPDSDDYHIVFGTDAPVSCTGDIRTLVDYEDPENADTGSARFMGLFYGCDVLTVAPELPAMDLSESCYADMFKGCSALTSAPELPATELAEYCYAGMFAECSSLTTAPELRAPVLAAYCYYGMFIKCSSLASVTMLATDISADKCLWNWMYKTAQNGTFTKNTSASIPSGSSGIPEGWSVANR